MIRGDSTASRKVLEKQKAIKHVMDNVSASGNNHETLK